MLVEPEEAGANALGGLGYMERSRRTRPSRKTVAFTVISITASTSCDTKITLASPAITGADEPKQLVDVAL